LKLKRWDLGLDIQDLNKSLLCNGLELNSSRKCLLAAAVAIILLAGTAGVPYYGAHFKGLFPYS